MIFCIFGWAASTQGRGRRLFVVLSVFIFVRMIRVLLWLCKKTTQEPKSIKARITRASLVVAAAAIMQEEGPSAVTYRSVAKRANTAASSTGYYFDSISDLL